jgi:predicted membrane protein
MRLDPKQVRFVRTMNMSLQSGALQFVGKESNIQLLETALVVEGNLLKVMFLGFERIFRQALAEWTSVTIPFSRIDRAKQINWPPLRAFALILAMLLGLGTVLVFLDKPSRIGVVEVTFIPILMAVCIYVVFRVKGRYEVRYRTKDGRRRRILFTIKSKPIRKEFIRRLNEYRQAAKNRTATGVD